MSEPIILIGGGGHARVVIDCIQSAGGVVAGILDDYLQRGTLVMDAPVLGPISEYKKYTENCFLIAIGNNDARKRIALSLDVRWATVVHPSAMVSAYARVGPGTVVMPGAVINTGAVVGSHCIVNTISDVEHDCVLDDFVHISPRVVLGGTVIVGNGTHIGLGACLRNNISICDNCVVGAGAVVVSDITEPGVYIGVPARRMK